MGCRVTFFVVFLKLYFIKMFQQTTRRLSYTEISEIFMVTGEFLLFKMCEMEITEAHWGEFFNHHH